MRCKIKAPDQAAYDTVLSLLEETGSVRVTNPGRLLISADLTDGSPLLAILDAGATISKEYQFAID